MKQASGALTSPNSAGAKREFGLPCPAIISGSTAVDPLTGESFFLIMPFCNTACMNVFMQELSKEYPDDIILLCCDGAAWHKSGSLIVPKNIRLFYIPPYTPEMNPIEQIWRELRRIGFRNEVFLTLDKVVDRLCSAICSLTAEVIRSVTLRDWIFKCFN